MDSIFGNSTWVSALVLPGAAAPRAGFLLEKKLSLGQQVTWLIIAFALLPAAAVAIQRRGSLDLKAGKSLQLSCDHSSLCSHPPDAPESAALYCQETKP